MSTSFLNRIASLFAAVVKLLCILTFNLMITSFTFWHSIWWLPWWVGFDSLGPFIRRTIHYCCWRLLSEALCIFSESNISTPAKNCFYLAINDCDKGRGWYKSILIKNYRQERWQVPDLRAYPLWKRMPAFKRIVVKEISVIAVDDGGCRYFPQPSHFVQGAWSIEFISCNFSIIHYYALLWGCEWGRR